MCLSTTGEGGGGGWHDASPISGGGGGYTWTPETTEPRIWKVRTHHNVQRIRPSTAPSSVGVVYLRMCAVGGGGHVLEERRRGGEGGEFQGADTGLLWQEPSQRSGWLDGIPIVERRTTSVHNRRSREDMARDTHCAALAPAFMTHPPSPPGVY